MGIGDGDWGLGPAPNPPPPTPNPKTRTYLKKGQCKKIFENPKSKKLIKLFKE
jgi:hypothetical protein